MKSMVAEECINMYKEQYKQDEQDKDKATNIINNLKGNQSQIIHYQIKKLIKQLV